MGQQIMVIVDGKSATILLSSVGGHFGSDLVEEHIKRLADVDKNVRISVLPAQKYFGKVLLSAIKKYPKVRVMEKNYDDGMIDDVSIITSGDEFAILGINRIARMVISAISGRNMKMFFKSIENARREEEREGWKDVANMLQ